MMYVARRAGHQKVSTTHDFYSHEEKTRGFNLAETFEKTLDTAETTNPEKFKEAIAKTAQLLDSIGD